MFGAGFPSCPGAGDVPQPLVAALSSPSAQTPRSFLQPLELLYTPSPHFLLFPLSFSSMGSFLPMLWRRVQLPLSIAEISAACQGQGGFSFHSPFSASSLCMQGAPSVNPRAQEAGCTQITTTHQTAQMRNGQLSTGNEKSCVNIIKKTANATGEIINKKYICSFLPSEMRMGDGGFPS